MDKCKEVQRFIIQIEDSGDQNENLKRFWLECFRVAAYCFPATTLKMSQVTNFAVCPRVDIARALNPE